MSNPPKNIIVPQKKVDQWDQLFVAHTTKLSQLDERMQAEHKDNIDKLNQVYVTKLQLTEAVESATRWAMIRDTIIILLLLAVLVIAAANTSVIQGWLHR